MTSAALDAVHDGGPRRPPTLAKRLEHAAWALLCAGLVLALVEQHVVALRTDLGLFAWLSHAALGTVVVAWSSVIAAALVASCALLGGPLLARLRLPPAAADGLANAVTGLAIGAVGVVVMRPWNLRNDPFHFAFSVPAACTLAWPVGARLVRARPRLCAAVAVAVAIVLAELNARWFRGLYVSLHHGLSWLTWTALASVLAPQLDGGRVLLRALPWGVALVAHAGLGTAASAREVAALHGHVTPAFLGALQRLTDRDLDGYSAQLGGGDCDDASPDVHPGSCERPDNGIDDNCNGATDREALGETRAPVASTRRTVRTPLPDVYFVVVDTLRADYGAAQGHAARPRCLDALAAESLTFTRAYAAYPATFKSLSALLQSRSPRHYLEGGPDLGSLLARAGYTGELWIADETRPITAEATATWPLTRDNHPFRTRVVEGWATWSERIVERAVAELSVPSAAPRFRWLHMLDLHGPWVHAPPRGDLRTRYAAELAHVERQLERLLGALTEHARTRDAVIVVMGDHGEQLGEHGATFHDAFVWEESIRTPLFMRLPGAGSRTITQPASLLDVAPTLLDHLGLAAPPSFHGHDWLGPPAPRARPVVSEVGGSDLGGGVGNPARHAVIGERYKLVLDVTENVVSLYDLARDPSEQRPLHRRQVPAAERLFAELRRFQDEPGCTQP